MDKKQVKAKVSTNPLNDVLNFKDVSKFPVLFEQRIKGVQIDMHYDPRTFKASKTNISQVYRIDRVRGHKLLVDQMAPTARGLLRTI